MNAVLQRPPEGDFHAYVDGRLESARRGEVELWLASHADDAERINAWRRHKEALHATFDNALEDQIPERLLRAARPPRNRLWGIAAMLGWLTIGGISGFILRGAPPAAVPVSTLARNAAIAHVVYSPEVRHPVEVGADQEAHLVQWLSKRLGTPVRIPHFTAEGFELVGGRLLPGEQGPVAQFMYQDGQGRRLTLYVRTDAAENRETAFRFALEGRVSVFYWLDGRLGYALSGELPRDQLLSLSEAAYRQLNP
jgi:anti-sigma factor RsiW